MTVNWVTQICDLNLFGVTMEYLIMKLVAFAMPDATRVTVKDAALPPPPPALPHDARHARQIKSAVVLKKRHVVGIVVTRRSTLRSGVQNGVHKA